MHAEAWLPPPAVGKCALYPTVSVPWYAMATVGRKRAAHNATSLAAAKLMPQSQGRFSAVVVVVVSFPLLLRVPICAGFGYGMGWATLVVVAFLRIVCG